MPGEQAAPEEYVHRNTHSLGIHTRTPDASQKELCGAPLDPPCNSQMLCWVHARALQRGVGRRPKDIRGPQTERYRVQHTGAGAAAAPTNALVKAAVGMRHAGAPPATTCVNPQTSAGSAPTCVTLLR